MNSLKIILILCLFFTPILQFPVPSVSPLQLDYINFIKGTYGKNLSVLAAERGLPEFEKNFTSFCKQFKKDYRSNEEIEYRKGNFLYSLDLVQNANRDYENGRAQYRLAVNRFADFGMNENFFISQKWINANYIQAHQSPPNSGKFFWDNYNSPPDDVEVNYPKSFDWRSKNVVTAVQDQGNCGSCWIFAGISVVESANAIAKNPLVELSKQEMMDCVRPTTYISDGCQGGTVDDVYSFVQKSGVVTAKVYPYTGRVGKCKDMNSYWSETISSYNFLPINATDDQMMWALYNKGPLAAVINAGDRHFALYSGGVLTTAGSRDLYSDYNHYITIVGWGNEGGYDYWLVKNSWGPDWGEDGYVKLARGINNRGINTVVSYAEAQKQSGSFNDTAPGSASFVGTGSYLTHLTVQIIVIFMLNLVVFK